MLGTPLDIRVRRTLGVTVSAGLALTLDESASIYFPAHLAQPQGDNALLDGSPRTSLSPWRLYWQTIAVELGGCDRIEADGTVYELIAQPRKISNGRLVVGYSAPVLPVSLLYPRSAAVKAKGEAATLETIACAIYAERDTSTARGAYVDMALDAPPSAFDALTGAPNRELHFSDGSVWTATGATLAPELPYVTAAARKVA